MSKEQNDSHVQRPLVELVMIVKNCMHSISETLNPIRDLIDHWTILDTGSTDGSIDMIPFLMKDIKADGTLYQEDFVDFATTRNRALELSSKTCEWTLMIDDSYQLVGGENFRVVLEELRKQKDVQGAQTCIKTEDGVSYYSPRLFRTDANVKYEYPIHEAITSHSFNSVIPQSYFHFFDQEYDESYERRSARIKNDLFILNKFLSTEPENKRMTFYLAQTHKNLKNYESALICYKNRIQLGAERDDGMDHEFFISYLAVGEIEEHLNGWEKSIKWYLECFNNFPKSAEPLYKIAFHYFNNDMYQIALVFAQQAIDLQEPAASLNPTNSVIYTREIPKLYYRCVKMLERKDLIPKALQACKKVITHEPEEFNNYKNYLDLKKDQWAIDKSKTRIVFTAPQYYGTSWNANNLNTTGIGGSESAVINMSKQMVNHFDEVYVFMAETKEETIDGVQYKDITGYDIFLNTHFVDMLICSRDATMLRYNNVKKVYLWMHDIKIPYCMSYIDESKLDGVLVLSEFHEKIMNTAHGELLSKNLLVQTRNGINTSLIQNATKKKHSFIYSSCPTRGLIPIINVWHEIKRRIPDATLEIFGNFNTPVARENIDVPLLLKTIKNLKFFDVTYHGFVNKETLMNAYAKADVWLYPTEFPEVSCITAMEAFTSGCLCIHSNFAALAETLDNRGVVMHHLDIDKLVEILKTNDQSSRPQVTNEWKEFVDWKTIAAEWVNTL